MSRQNRLDIYLAFGLFLCCAAVSVLAYANILKLEQPSHILAKNLHSGTQKYKIISKGSCIGEYKSSLANKQNYFLTSEGEINTVYGKERSIVRLGMSAQFNPLGQLIESQLSISNLRSKFNLTTASINPIQLNVDAQISGRAFNHSLSIPGPINIVKHAGDTFQIEYSRINNNTGGFLKTLGTTLVGEIDLQFLPADQSTISCAPAERGYFDMAGLILKANSSGAFLDALVPKMEK